jgi:NitT/TauT family transport system substrate-binding protein
MRSWRATGLAALAMVILAACGTPTASQPAGAGAPEKKHLVVAVGGQDQFIYLPLTLANQLGYFKDEGLEIEVANFSGGGKAAEALIGGQADVVTGFYDHTIDTQPVGEHLVMVCLYDRFPGLVLLVSKQSANQIKSIKDLRGKTVGVTARGSSTDFMVGYLLSKEGMKREDVNVTPVGTGAAFIAALQQNRIQAGVTVDPAATRILQAGDGVVLKDTRTPEGTKDVYGGNYPAGGNYTTVEFVKKNPNTVQHLVNASVRALRWIQTHTPEQIADKMPTAYYGGDRALYVASLTKTMPLFSPDGLIPADGPATVLNVLKLNNPKVASAQIDLKATYDMRFVQNAPKK